MQEMTDQIDITQLIDDCASSLSLQDPFLANIDSFNLGDAMAAVQLMDPLMDSCECSAKLAAPLKNDPKSSQTLHPRPSPTGLADPFLCLPWENLSQKDVVNILVEITIRIQALFSANSVGETTFTCFYAFYPVVTDMLAEIDNLHTCQLVVLAATVALLDLTQVFRDICLNADIYEEEDFCNSTYDLQLHLIRPKGGTRLILQRAMDSVDDDGAESKIIKIVLDILFGMLSICTGLAQLTANQLLNRIASIQLEVEQTVQSIQCLFDAVDDGPQSRVVFQTFDMFVNRPLLGNVPVRKVTFFPRRESFKELSKFIRELELLVNIIHRGNSLSRMHKLLEIFTDCNILSRSILVLNLFFDDKILGQHDLDTLIFAHMQLRLQVPANILANESAKQFVKLLAKPVYDNLKLLALNSNRQRPFIEGLLVDWLSCQNEANYADVRIRHDLSLDSSTTPPYFSQYVLSTLIQNMDRYVACGIRVGLYHGHYDIAFAFWYRDFLLSALLTSRSMNKSSKELFAKGQKPEPRKKIKKNKKNKNEKTNEELEDEFEVIVIGLKRMLCRGLLRFIASLIQAGMLTEPEFEFTSLRRIFEKRFEVFAEIQQPPPLTYDDFLEGMSFESISLLQLIQTTAEWFQTCKSTADKLLASVSTIDSDFVTTESELRALLKVCVGNTIYVRKLEQLVCDADHKVVKVEFDFTTHGEFCTLKLI